MSLTVQHTSQEEQTPAPAPGGHAVGDSLHVPPAVSLQSPVTSPQPLYSPINVSSYPRQQFASVACQGNAGMAEQNAAGLPHPCEPEALGPPPDYYEVVHKEGKAQFLATSVPNAVAPSNVPVVLGPSGVHYSVGPSGVPFVPGPSSVPVRLGPYNVHVAVMQQNAPGSVMIIRQPPVMPNDNMQMALYVTLCFCFCLGLAAVLKSQEVRRRYMEGDYEGAEKAARESKNLSVAGIVTAVVMGTTIAVVYFALISSVKTS